MYDDIETKKRKIHNFIPFVSIHSFKNVADPQFADSVNLTDNMATVCVRTSMARVYLEQNNYFTKLSTTTFTFTGPLSGQFFQNSNLKYNYIYLNETLWNKIIEKFLSEISVNVWESRIWRNRVRFESIRSTVPLKICTKTNFRYDITRLTDRDGQMCGVSWTEFITSGGIAIINLSHTYIKNNTLFQ